MNKATKQQIRTKMTRSKFLRLALCPVMALRRKHLLSEYVKSEDSEYIKSLHNKYEGKRCFIIGNGPSLTPEDLDRIKGEYSFASNRIYYIYEMTQWRPTWYLSIDNNVITSEIENIKRIGAYPKLINYKAKRYGREEGENIHYICTRGDYHVDINEPSVRNLSDDASLGVSWVGTVTVNAIELAAYMGFKEIYLLGVDNNYARKMDKNGCVTVDATMQSSYFKGMKSPDGKADDGYSVQLIDSMNYAYDLAKKFAEKHGVKIYNTTRGGKLETFERVDFDKLMK